MKKVITYPYIKCSRCHDTLTVCESVKASTCEEGIIIECFNCWYEDSKIETELIELRAQRKILKELIKDKLGY